MKLPIYLDYMATTPVDPRVAKKMQDCLMQTGYFGNPASQSHEYGLQARAIIETAREQVAELIGATHREIIWTSGATEANNLALKGAAYFYQRKGKHIVTVQTEHKAVLDVCRFLESQGFTVTYLKPEPNGLLDLTQFEAALREDTILVSVMHVNNEIGVIQNIEAIGKLTRPRGILFHVDAAQSAGKIPIKLDEWNVDLMSFSAHKVYGPKGMGALYVRRQPRVHLQPLLHGGGHEWGLRSGTLHTHQIIGMGEAFAIAKNEMLVEAKKTAELWQLLWQQLQQLDGVFLNGDDKHRVPENMNVSFVGIDAENLMLALQQKLAVSSGAACTAAELEPSHVLRALGVSPLLARNSLRISLGRYTTKEEIIYAADVLLETIKKLRS